MAGGRKSGRLEADAQHGGGMNSRRRLIGDRSAGRHRHSGGRVGGHGHNHARQRVAVKGVARRHVVDDESGCVGLRRCSRDSDRGMEARYRWMAVGVGEQKRKRRRRTALEYGGGTIAETVQRRDAEWAPSRCSRGTTDRNRGSPTNKKSGASDSTFRANSIWRSPSHARSGVQRQPTSPTRSSLERSRNNRRRSGSKA